MSQYFSHPSPKPGRYVFTLFGTCTYLADPVVADKCDCLVEHDEAGEGDVGDPQSHAGGGEEGEQEDQRGHLDLRAEVKRIFDLGKIVVQLVVMQYLDYSTAVSWTYNDKASK